MIKIEDLSARYGRKVALDCVSAEFARGVVALLGPNGAGKTTLLSSIATLRRVPPRRISIDGTDISTRSGKKEARRQLGWLPQRFELAGGMTALEATTYAAWANGVDARRAPMAARNALLIVDLDDRAGQRVRQLSGGQRQRLALAASLSHNPKVLLLDEPTVGLDPEQRVRFRSYLRTASAGRSVVLATHLLEDVRTTADHLLVLVGGRVRFAGSVQALAALGGETGDPLESPLERGYRALIESGGPGCQ